MVKDYHFDFKMKRYKVVKRVGPVGFGEWKRFKSLDYVSMFQNVDGLFELKLWYNTNKNFSIEYFRTKENAREVGEKLARDLELSFYDATEENIIEYESDDAEKIPDEIRNVDARIFQPKRPFWQLFTAGIFYTAAIFSVVIFYTTLEINSEAKQLFMIPQIFEITWIFILVALSFSVLRDYHFDFRNKQYKEIYKLGPFKYGKWKQFRSIDYISVYRKRRKKIIVNLWYNDNKRINLAEYNNFKDAMFHGERVARTLKIDLLDARDPHNTKWVELN